MFARLSRSGAPARRSRRHLLLIVVAVLVVAIVVGEVVDDVVKSGPPASKQVATSWTAAVGPIIGDSNGLALTSQSLRNRIGELTPDGLDSRLDALVTGTRADVTALSSLAIPPASPRASALLTRVLADRAAAAAEIRSGVGLARSAAPGRTTRATALLAAAGSRLVAADASYRAFRRALPGPLRRRVPATSQWVAEPSAWRPAGLAAFVAALTGTPALATRRALSIVAISFGKDVVNISGLPPTTTLALPAVTTTTTTSLPGGAASSSTTSSTTTTTLPLPTTTTLQLPPPGASAVVQPHEPLRVAVVVRNTGTALAPGVVVSASLRTTRLPKGANPKGKSAVHESVGSIAPGSSRYVNLPPMGVASGAAYTLTVAATTPGAAAVVRTLALTVAT